MTIFTLTAGQVYRVHFEGGSKFRIKITNWDEDEEEIYGEYRLIDEATGWPGPIVQEGEWYHPGITFIARVPNGRL